MEKQVSDFGKQHLHTIIESGSEGIVADDSAVVGRQSHPSDVCLYQRVLQVDFDWSFDGWVFVELSLALGHDFSDDLLVAL